MTKHTAPSRVNAESTDLPIARLDVQDLEQSLSLREYLEQNGVAVVVNRKPAIQEMYHIICGDLGFVKERAASVYKSDSNLFVVLFLKNREKVPAELHDINAKIAVVTGMIISARDTHKIFAYFFTSDEDTFYLENDEQPMMELKPVQIEMEETEKTDEMDVVETPGISPIVEESLMPDAQRVSRVIGEMFGDKKIRESKTIRRRDDETTKKGNKTVKRMGYWRASFIITGVLIAPVTWYLVSLAMIAAIQWYGVGTLKRGDISRITMVDHVTTYWVGQGKGALALIGFPATIVGGGRIIRSQERVLSIISDIITAEHNTADLITESRQIVPLLFALPSGELGTQVPLPVTIDRIRLALDGLTSSLGLAGAQLRIIAADGQFPFTIPPMKDMMRRGEEGIGSILVQAGTIRNILALYRAAGGFDEKKTYLILLQNSMELRPTGGFIGSIAIVTLTDGAMETPVVQDVYELDGQLKGHVDPPIPIKEVLQQEHWYLRDSNWDPDFSESGQRARWFYEKETGQSVDGVIAVSTPVLTDLLSVTGPLDLPDYNDRITKENFFGKSLFYTKADFFPGSTQKKDFLGSLMVALLGRISSGNPGDALGLMQGVSRALTRGDIQFWFPERGVQVIAEQAGWAGDVVRPMPCETSSSPCVAERVALVEANLGVNKVNPYIKRSVKTRIDLSEDGAVDGAVEVTYQNTSTDDAALSGGGVYLAYLRAYVPADTRVLSVNLDGEEIPPKAANVKSRTLPYRDADETSGGLTTVSVAFTVPPGVEKTLTMTYQRGIPLTFVGGETTFVLSIRKQPGITDTTLDTAIGYPAGWKLETDDSSSGKQDTAIGLLANAREVRYNTTLDQTKIFVVRFRK